MCRKASLRMTFADFFAVVYLPHAQARKRSWDLDNRLAKRHILPHFAHLTLGSITRKDVECWLGALVKSGLAASSCNRILAILKSAFALARGLEFIARSPCQEVKELKTQGGRERFLSRAEGNKLLAYLGRADRAEAAILRLLLLTGARKSEIRKACWENVDLDKGILTVPVTKSGRQRYIYLSDAAIQIIREISPTGSPWLFPGRDASKPISDIYRFWNTARNAMGLKDVRIHDLRHSFASFLVAAGQSLYMVQQLLGHADPRTTMRYAHLAHKTLVEAAACIMKVLNHARRSWKSRRCRKQIPLTCHSGSQARRGKRRAANE